MVMLGGRLVVRVAMPCGSEILCSVGGAIVMMRGVRQGPMERDRRS